MLRPHRPRTTTSAVAVAGAAVVAVCAIAFGIGVHAAVGDHDGPGVLLAHPGIAPSDPAVDGSGGSLADGRGSADDAGDDERPIDGSPAPTPAPTPVPGPTPAPTPDAGTPAPTHPRVSTDPTDPMSPRYNPYVTPGDPAFVTDEAKRAWLGRQAVVRACMAEAGFSYLEWQWWFGGSPLPPNLDAAGEAAWMAALRGSGGADASTGGCEAVAAQAAEEADAAGTPLDAPIPPAPDGPTQREHWLEFQDAVRTCMSDAGYEYRYWEYWNPAYPATGGSPAMPTGLDDAQRAAWNTAAFGDAAGGDGSTASGGCWTVGAQQAAWREWG
ncbi:hypothetical protein ACGGZK_04925 [Agromyces sp. MMS24-K17]|uniref:hypothetical protein n=1 Tax=Agromyces sp. MMS24-K17 TaxID=3372850 RepID=UPI003755231E